MPPLQQQICLLDLRAEQLRIHLQALCTASAEARRVRSEHGFDGRETGMISIKLEREARAYVLAIKDNGRLAYSW